uniref:Uncharacterized protein n=1 Tax=Xiphophorus couchianus TaxID=32473 RepID=A0A3B5LVK6_9TELE
MEFAIQHTWDSKPVDHEPIRLGFHPPTEPSLPDLSLRIYEGMRLISIFLDIRVYAILLTFHIYDHMFEDRQLLPIEFTITITGDTWQGQALIPWTYFRPNVNKMNCYASHGLRENRTHEALYPVPKEGIAEGLYPDSIMGEDWVQPESDLWRGKA